MKNNVIYRQLLFIIQKKYEVR